MTIAVRLQELFDALPIAGRDYYALTLLLGQNGEIEVGCQTLWVRYTDEEPRREIREARLVNPERHLELWKALEEPGMVVNTADDFALFFACGGNALVERGLAATVVPDWLAPAVSINVGQCGFASPSNLPSGALQRAPSPKLRMSIIKRDAYKCRVCGRSPAGNSDIELHVHHVRPWAAGGVTEESNLMTLCHTCHNGLDPHYEISLFQLMPKPHDSSRGSTYANRVRRYQEYVAEGASRSDV
jgi:hypothetical protein